MKPALRRGMSQIMVWTLIIAATVAILAGTVSWILSVWAEQGTYSLLHIFPDSEIDWREKVLRLHIKNYGTVAATIYKIEILHMEIIEVNEVIEPGEEKTITIDLAKDYTPGSSYIIYVYTKAGDLNKYRFTVPVD